MDFFSMHGELIQKSSFLDSKFMIPMVVEEVSSFLPGKSKYHDLDELLIDIGSSHDRDFLRSTVSKIFLVPLSLFVEAEEDRRNIISRNVLDAVQRRRQTATDAEAAAETKDDEEEDIGSIPAFGKISSGVSSVGSTVPTNGSADLEFEVADPEYLCEECLPVYGDDIIGTRASKLTNGLVPSHFVTTVHRCGCPIAQKALNSKHSIYANGDKNAFDGKSLRRNDDKSKLSLRTRLKLRLPGRSHRQESEPSQEAVSGAKVVPSLVRISTS